MSQILYTSYVQFHVILKKKCYWFFFLIFLKLRHFSKTHVRNNYVSSSAGASYLFCVWSPVTWHSQNVPHDNFRLIICIQRNMSSVSNPGTCWYFCASTGYTSDSRRRMKYGCMPNVQFYANSRKRNQAIPPPPLTSELNSSFLLGVFF